MPTKGVPDGKRRRDRVAESALRRIDTQRAATATRYGRAGTDRERLAVLVDALAAATAPGAHQIPDDALARFTGPAITAVRDALDGLHDAQRRRAQKTLSTETERRKRRDHQPARCRAA